MNDHRLGEKRRMRSEYSLHQRDAGTEAIDRMANKRAKAGIALCTLVNYIQSKNITCGISDLNLVGMILLLVSVVVRCERPCLLIPQPLPRDARFVYTNALDDTAMTTATGFTHEQFHRMVVTFGIPDYITINEGAGNRHSSHFHGKTAFFIFLARYHSDFRKLGDLQRSYGYDYTVISKVFTTLLDFMDSRYAHLYDNLAGVLDRFAEFNDCIVRAIARHHAGEVPQEARRIAFFVDGSRVPIGKPERNRIQREWYNFKYGHNAGEF